jgi:hypothetical protein
MEAKFKSCPQAPSTRVPTEVFRTLDSLLRELKESKPRASRETIGALLILRDRLKASDLSARIGHHRRWERIRRLLAKLLKADSRLKKVESRLAS